MICSTIGCHGATVAVLEWHDGYGEERVCEECADSYSRRPALRSLATVRWEESP